MPLEFVYNRVFNLFLARVKLIKQFLFSSFIWRVYVKPEENSIICYVPMERLRLKASTEDLKNDILQRVRA